MHDAYAATQLALAREQRISAVGSLAAAAAHQLGSPLATIAVVAKELARDLPSGSPYAADAELLLSQSERCRTILADLAASARWRARLRLSRGCRFRRWSKPRASPISRPRSAVDYRIGAGRDAARSTGRRAARARAVPRSCTGSAILSRTPSSSPHKDVAVTSSWSEDTVAVDIADDGPGFPASVLARIGEPYISGRTALAQHMGLGIFIAQSLLERTGARLSFGNLADRGAHVVIEWRRRTLASIEKSRRCGRQGNEQRSAVGRWHRAG